MANAAGGLFSWGTIKELGGGLLGAGRNTPVIKDMYLADKSMNALKGGYGVMKTTSGEISKRTTQADNLLKAQASRDQAIAKLEKEKPDGWKQKVADLKDSKDRLTQRLETVNTKRGTAQEKYAKEGVGGVLGGLRDWATAADYKDKGRAGVLAARWGGAAAGSMALGAVTRPITGGGFTYNNSGERDIAGIPFI